MSNYTSIEKKWQKYWEDHESFKAKDFDKSRKHFYLLVEFPYPSGAGLHVGHVRSYTSEDVRARMMRMQGYNVLFPMGFDAFGAPAEQYAIKTHQHPKDVVKKNVETFKNQMKECGFSFDWSRSFSTTDPDYYKWTQWQFIQFYKHGMAYKTNTKVNWCPKCKMVLSNEDAAGGVCERCGTRVEQREKSQWMLKMASYADSLLDGLKDTNFQDKIKLGQINWIGKSSGARITFKVKDSDKSFDVFTTRCDTLFGVTYCVLAPEHKLVSLITTPEHKDEVEKYKKECTLKNELERTDLNKDKTGVFTGSYAVNPVTGEDIPIYISDYVLTDYGTGAIMAVPAHDSRDYDFAKKFNLPIVQVLEEETGEKHDGETFKNSIVAIVYDEKNNKYLTINWGKNVGRLFVGGSIKDGEDALSCALREVKEKTGYDNLEFVRETFKINHHYYSYNKDKYFNIESTGFLFKLKDDHKVSQKLDPDEEFNVEWVSSDAIEKDVKDELHAKTFQYALNDSAMEGDGIHINSDFLNGMNKEDAINAMLKYLEDKKIGKKEFNYKMRDWVFGRQRFWGEPIPMIYCKHCGWVPVPDKDLPVLLPDVHEYEPTDNGESPLAKIDSFVNCKCPKCGTDARRETDTMPQWAGSSWYFLRYMDPHNNKEFASMDNMKYWDRVDYYDGGNEHTARHLLYARFWVQFLYNIGLVPKSEMIWTRVNHGMILGPDGNKMSKSKGNVINPDDIVKDYGADTLRVYEMFMGDYQQDAPWSTEALRGCYKFIGRVERIAERLDVNKKEYSDPVLANKTIKKVEDDINNLKFNTAISAIMIMLNSYEKMDSISKDDYRLLLILLNPFAPHITEELNEKYGLGKPFCESNWPKYDSSLMVDSTLNIAVQVNGKVRATISISKDEDEESVLSKALSEENVIKFTKDKEIIKKIYVKDRIVNIVVK